MKITVSVTQEDIDKGCKGDYTACPIQRAVARQVDARVEVTESEITFEKNYHWDGVTTPIVARDFIRSYDGNEQVAPFSFELEIPEGVVLK
jgi:hypothetical protein